jgi:hypothetical protein
MSPSSAAASLLLTCHLICLGGGRAAAEEAAPAGPNEAALPAALRSSFEGEPAWLVLGESHKTHAAAARRAALRRAIRETTVVSSDFFAALEPGHAVLVHGAYADRAAAEKAVAELAQQGIRAYAKHSGKRKPARLVRVWGRLGTDLTRVSSVVLSIGQTELETAADAQGWFEAWLPASGAQEEISAAAVMLPPRQKGCSGWFDKGTSQKFDGRARQVRLDLSPSPDCCSQ